MLSCMSGKVLTMEAAACHAADWRLHSSLPHSLVSRQEVETLDGWPSLRLVWSFHGRFGPQTVLQSLGRGNRSILRQYQIYWGVGE